MTQLGGRHLAQMWMAMSSALAEQHLAVEAIAAYVDGELSLLADDRATRHLARCTLCTAEVAAQRQARTAVRSASVPTMTPTLLAALHAIPQSVDLPPAPEQLAVDENGELVMAQRPLAATALGLTAPLGSGERLGSCAALGSTTLGSTTLGPSTPATTLSPSPTLDPALSGPQRGRRRVRQGAGVVVSGLVLGALALTTPLGSTMPGAPLPGAEGGGSPPATAVPARFEVGPRTGSPLPESSPATANGLLKR